MVGEDPVEVLSTGGSGSGSVCGDVALMIDKTIAEHYPWGQRCDGWHLVKAGSFSVIQERMPPSTAEVRHRHSASRQFFFVLSGEATVETEGTTQVLRVHQGIEIPPQVAHQVTNRFSADLEFLVVSVPPSHGDRILA